MCIYGSKVNYSVGDLKYPDPRGTWGLMFKFGTLFNKKHPFQINLLSIFINIKVHVQFNNVLNIYFYHNTDLHIDV